LNLANLTTMRKMVECVRSRLLENLRMLPHAPGVQMADIPEDSLDINQDELRDAANPDTRVTSIMKVGLFSHLLQCFGSALV
jgi:histone deacetylase 1/2